MKRLNDIRGNAKDRRKRREFLVSVFSKNKQTISCYHCQRELIANSSDWQVDRFPQCGHDGGRYLRNNIVPACEYCNVSRCTVVCKRYKGVLNVQRTT